MDNQTREKKNRNVADPSIHRAEWQRGRKVSRSTAQKEISLGSVTSGQSLFFLASLATTGTMRLHSRVRSVVINKQLFDTSLDRARFCATKDRQGWREMHRGESRTYIRAGRYINVHGQVLCASLLEQSAPRGIGTPLSRSSATELATDLVTVG